MRAMATLIAAAGALLLGATAQAAEVRVAVAANFTEPAKAIAAAFEKASGDTVIISPGASGGIYNQIAHGAPYDIFLSADAERPARLTREGLAVKGSGFTYALGRLVLWSRTPGLVDPQGRVLFTDRFAKLAIADPDTAPYGKAAVQTLARLGLQPRVQPRIVQGESVAQTYQFVATGVAELGFVGLSQVVDQGGSRWVVPSTLHDPIVQDAVLLRRGADKPAARAFLAYLRSPTAAALIRRYGYDRP